MKNRFFLVVLLFVSLFLGACSDTKEYVEPQLEVTPNNLAGVWELKSWHNGLSLAEGSYVYVELIRKDSRFNLYQNIDSFSTRLLTGSFAVELDEELGAVLRGMYDFDGGEWGHRYIVKSLTAKEMIWVAKDDPSEVSVYVRSEIPSEVLDALYKPAE